MNDRGIKRLHGFVSGRVQGVFFRAHTEKKAQQLELQGWVRNLVDGRVEVAAEGSEQALKAFLEWLHEGPPAAHVDRVDTTWEPASGEAGFRIVLR